MTTTEAPPDLGPDLAGYQQHYANYTISLGRKEYETRTIFLRVVSENTSQAGRRYTLFSTSDGVFAAMGMARSDYANDLIGCRIWFRWRQGRDYRFVKPTTLVVQQPPTTGKSPYMTWEDHYLSAFLAEANAAREGDGDHEHGVASTTTRPCVSVIHRDREGHLHLDPAPEVKLPLGRRV